MAVAAESRVTADGGALEAPIRYAPALVWCLFVLIVLAGARSIGLLHFESVSGTNPPALTRLLSGESPFQDAIQRQLERSGVTRASDEILGPFSDITAHVAAAIYTAALPEASESSLHWALLALTPLIALALFALRGGRGAMTVSGVFAWLFNGGITQITLMNMGLLSFIYALNANFRHYHVCFRYPRWLEYWLQSPGMHHSHHSRLKQHWDSNLGLFTNIWDRLYGTLYIGESFESTPWGLPDEQQARCSSLADNLLAPFREIAAMLRPGSPSR